jgi:hypothetical protein
VSQTVALEEQVAGVLAPVPEAAAIGAPADGAPARELPVGAEAAVGADSPVASLLPVPGHAGKPVPAAQPVPAQPVPAGQPVPVAHQMPVPVMRPVPARAGDKAVLELGEQVSDGVVSVTVRRDSPLKTTLLATRKRDRGREPVSVS